MCLLKNSTSRRVIPTDDRAEAAFRSAERLAICLAAGTTRDPDRRYRSSVVAGCYYLGVRRKLRIGGTDLRRLPARSPMRPDPSSQPLCYGLNCRLAGSVGIQQRPYIALNVLHEIIHVSNIKVV